MGRRSLTVGAAAVACVVGALSVVLLTGAWTRSSSASRTGGASRSGSPTESDRTSQGSGLATCAMPTTSVASGGWTLVATTRGTVARYAAPGGAPDGVIPASWYGAVSALPVVAEQPKWLEVRLATRPDGSTAWVNRADVTVTSTPYWISVDLATRHLSLFRLGRQLLSAPAGVGTGQDPTPTGEYFVAFFEASPSPGYGPFIIVTSAHSTSIADWEGSGDAVIGIHGPLGADSLIGTTGAYLSHGCVRIPIPDLVRLRDVPAGSPISICG